MKQTVLDKIHSCEFEILNEVVNLCEKHDINYLLFFGTLLGSVRHKGFIPWDDDIDIAMPRNEYNRFLKIAQEELSEKFLLEHISFNKNYYLPFIKVKNKNTEYVEEQGISFLGNKGLWIDIFPLDYVNLKQNKKFLKLRLRIINLFSAISLRKILKLNIFNKKINFLSKVFSNSLSLKLVDLLCLSKKSDYYVCYLAGKDPLKNIFSVNDIFPLKKNLFCGKKYNIPNNYDAVLKTLYGDYMKLPPIEKRSTHNPISVKFENGEVINFRKEE